MLILGLNNGIDAGAALIDDGRVLCCINEERLNRQKQFWGPPLLSVEAVLKTAGVDARDIDYVAQSSITGGGGPHEDFDRPPTIKRLVEHVSQLPLSHTNLLKSAYRFASSRGRSDEIVDRRLKELGITAPKRYIEHHLCHAATGYYCSQFADSPEDVLIVTADGVGDGICHTISTVGPDHRIHRHHETMIFHSIAEIYGYVTHNLGFRYNRHEGKITGLAAYGDSSKTIDVFRHVMSFDPQRLELRCHLGAWGRPAARKLHEMLKDHSREDVAAGLQRALEEVMSGMVQTALRRYGKKYLCVAGGLFCNVRLNQVLFELPEVEDIYVHPGMADTGQGLGAALGLRAELVARPNPILLRNVYLGPGFSDAEIETALEQSGVPYRKCENVYEETAKLLNGGKVVARFCGRMEYGPRALGHRSILYHTRDATVNTWLNKRLKRTEFMPFAPMVLRKRASEYFENFSEERSEAANFMTMTYRVTPKGSSEAPAATHVDGTARPQTVTQAENLDSWSILKSYEALTGSAILVNTSFNMHEEPIVCLPSDAIGAFLEGHLDGLAIGSFLAQLPESRRE